MDGKNISPYHNGFMNEPLEAAILAPDFFTKAPAAEDGPTGDLRITVLWSVVESPKIRVTKQITCVACVD
jgi:hypothetical protein